MYCPRCDAQILADDVHLGTLVARCRRCNEVFRFADQLGPPAPGGSIERRAAKPDRLLVEDNRDAQQISLAWTVGPPHKVPLAESRAAGWVVLLFSFAMIGFFGWLISDLAHSSQKLANHLVQDWKRRAADMKKLGLDAGPPPEPPPSVSPPFFALLVPIAGGLFLTYAGAALLLNRTTIRLDDNELTLRHAPLPWWGNRSFARNEIRRVCFDQRLGLVGRFLHYWYNVLVVAENGQTAVLLYTFGHPGIALFITQQLQEWLGPHPEQTSLKTPPAPSDAVWRPQS
jgi:hypothetical protein